MKTMAKGIYAPATIKTFARDITVRALSATVALTALASVLGDGLIWGN